VKQTGEVHNQNTVSEKILSSKIFLGFEHHFAMIPPSGKLRNICGFSGFGTTQQFCGKLPGNNLVLRKIGWIVLTCQNLSQHPDTLGHHVARKKKCRSVNPMNSDAGFYRVRVLGKFK